jgi:hypothetical protein
MTTSASKEEGDVLSAAEAVDVRGALCGGKTGGNTPL